MNEELVLNLLTRVLGPGYKKNGGNYSFKCPNFCHPIKNKLEVNITTGQYSCWVCGSLKHGFKGTKIENLFKSLKVEKKLRLELKNLTSKSSPNLYSSLPDMVEYSLSLPKEFKNFKTPRDLIMRHAFNYLKERNITQEDIDKHNIGYCEYGEYANRIIIPSYNSLGELNYFTGRSFMNNKFLPYLNPKISRDIIAFDLFINWDLPIILCEGFFDAIAIKRNAIPLLSNKIQDSLIKKIITSDVKQIYLALDKDALKHCLVHAEYFMKMGKEVYIVDINEKDPSKLGFRHFTHIIQKTPPLSMSGLLKRQIQIL